MLVPNPQSADGLHQFLQKGLQATPEAGWLKPMMMEPRHLALPDDKYTSITSFSKHRLNNLSGGNEHEYSLG